MYEHAARTLDGASGTMVTTDIADLLRQIGKILACLIIVAGEIIVSQKTQGIGDRHAFGTLSLALIAHTAVMRPYLFVESVQKPLVFGRVFF